MCDSSIRNNVVEISRRRECNRFAEELYLVFPPRDVALHKLRTANDCLARDATRVVVI